MFVNRLLKLKTRSRFTRGTGSFTILREVCQDNDDTSAGDLFSPLNLAFSLLNFSRMKINVNENKQRWPKQ